LPGLRTVLTFFAVTFLLTLPIWAISAASGLELLPGLPVAAVAVVCPGAAAVLLAHRQRGVKGSSELLARALDFGRIRSKGWWVPILLISPAVAVASFLVLRLSGSRVPDPQVTILGSLALFAFFLVGAVSEELGWSGFALHPLQARWGALASALVIGAVWAVWHYPALIQAHRSIAWIGWWALGTLAARVIMVWLFNSTGGSVSGVAVFHAVSNLCWQLFPIHGSWFDPKIDGLIMASLALVVILGTVRRDGDYAADARARMQE
jgi:membrane protease YdiL (CAAX protease family)